MRTAMMTIAATLLAFATIPALAGTLGTIPVGPGRSVSGELDAPGPQKWTVNLRRGRLYAVWSLAGEPGVVSVHAAGGRTVVSTPVIGEDGAHGADFVAPYTGSYTVQVACLAGGACPGRYDLGVEGDCRGDARTSCRIAAGQTLTGLSLFGNEDTDWRAVRLAAGRTYRVSGAGKTGLTMNLCLSVLDARGRELLGNDCDEPFSLTFTAPASGTYFVATAPGGDGAPGLYTLSVR
jgi:hypothetical protein